MEVISLIVEYSHRDSIKQTYDIYDTINNVLKNASENFGINSEEYEIRYNNKTLNKDLEIKQSDLPPDAHLKLYPCQCSNKQKVQVDLLLGNNVKSKKFKCSASLWDVFQELVPKDRFIEDERIMISCFGKTILGRTDLKNALLSSLPQNDGKISLNLSRKFSGDDLTKCDRHVKATSGNPVSYGRKISNHSKISPKKEVLETRTTSKSDVAKSKHKLITNPLSSYIKGETCVDKSFYMSHNEKLKGIAHLDERKGFIYNMKDLPNINKTSQILMETPYKSTNKREKEVHMKVIFPDQSVIQAAFDSEETIADIYNFIATVLKCSNDCFILYTKDPRCDFCEEKRLTDISDVSEDALYFRLSPGVPRLSMMSVLREVLMPSPKPKFKQFPKQWMFSLKKN